MNRHPLESDNRGDGQITFGKTMSSYWNSVATKGSTSSKIFCAAIRLPTSSCLKVENSWLIAADDSRGFGAPRGTANRIRRANSPPLVIGSMTGNFVVSLKTVGDTTRTGRCPRCSCPREDQARPCKYRPDSYQLTANGRASIHLDLLVTLVENSRTWPIILLWCNAAWSRCRISRSPSTAGPPWLQLRDGAGRGWPEAQPA